MIALEPEMQEKTKKEFLTPNDNSHFFIGTDFLKKKFSNYALSHIMFTTPIALGITNFFIFRCRNWLVTQWSCCNYHIHLKLPQFETGYHMFTFSQYSGLALMTGEFHFWSKVHLQLQNMNARAYYLQDWGPQTWTCLSLTWRQYGTQISGPHPRVPDLGRLGWGLRICISNVFRWASNAGAGTRL